MTSQNNYYFNKTADLLSNRGITRSDAKFWATLILIGIITEFLEAGK